MRAECLFAGISYKLITGSLDREVSDVVDDSRQATKDSVFVCRVGSVTDGHRFVEDAIKHGASGIILTDENEDADRLALIKGIVESHGEVFVVMMYDHRHSIGVLCNNFWEFPSKKLGVIGVTGTKGKTTVTYMMKRALEMCGYTTGLIGTIEIDDCSRHIQSVNTTPGVVTLHRTIYNMVANGAKYCVMEVSSQGLKLGRVSGVDFDVGVYTNISPDHIGKNEHECFEEYVRYKSTLFSMCRNIVINIDDMYAECMCGSQVPCGGKNDIQLVGYGVDHQSKKLYDRFSGHIPIYEGINVHETQNGGFPGNECELVTPNGDSMPMRIKIPGKFNVYNALAVIAAGDTLGLPINIVTGALTDIYIRGRMEPVSVSDEFLVYIDYAHNQASLESALRTLRPYCRGRIYCVFGCGGNRAKSRRTGMGKVAGMMADITIVTNDNPRFEDPGEIMDDIEDGLKNVGAEYIRIPDRKEAIRYGLTHAHSGDIVLLAGKGHETYQDVRGHKFHMDERELIGQILEEEDAGVICGRDNRYIP